VMIASRLCTVFLTHLRLFTEDPAEFFGAEILEGAPFGADTLGVMLRT